MDFGALLHIAKKNSETTKNQGNYYCTKYAPPKKESKDKRLSDNIQKFLQKRDQEERERKHDERQKVASLLAMRDEKAKNKIRKMLKVTKSANKSVLDDTKESGGTTAAVGQASDQVDQDDYGYVSTEANAFYQKYIEKVKDVKDDKGFAPSRPQSLRDLSGTKERVKAAITRERDEAKSHTRQRISTVNSTSSSSGRESTVNVARSYATSSKTLFDPQAEKNEEERKKREEEQKKVKNRKPPPPPINFEALLKLAEKKQHEPVAVVQPEIKKKSEPERLLSAREKRELEERQRFMEDRLRREREREKPKERNKDLNSSSSNNTNRVESNGRIPKLNQSTKSLTHSKATVSKGLSASTSNKPKPGSTAPKHGSSSTSSALTSKTAVRSLGKQIQNTTINKPTKTSSGPNKPPLNAAGHSTKAQNNQSKNPYGPTKNSAHNGPTREFPPRDLSTIKTQQLPPPDVKCPRQFPSVDVQRTRQFPPADVRRAIKPTTGSRKPPPPTCQKRRIYDDDEYDSELDDFIDDGDCEEDISSHIRDIFGYDKRKYRDFDDDDDNMESSFAQVQREEFISKKIGIQEDLEDMRQEAMEKKRKTQKKLRLRDDEEDD